MILKTIKHNFDNSKKIRKWCLEKIKDRKGRVRTWRQHLCFDKGYNSVQHEQELIKWGHVLLIPYKRNRCEELDEGKTRVIPNRKKHSAKWWVVERTNS